MRGILISGKMLSGKDHVANHIQEVAEARGMRVRRFGFADALKVSAARLLSYALGRVVSTADLENDKVAYRPFLQGYGRTMRNLYLDYWVNQAFNTIVRENGRDCLVGQSDPIWVNADTRFPNELDAKIHGFVVIRLKVFRPNQLERMFLRDGKIDETSLYDPSETALDAAEAAGPGPGTGRFDYILEDMPLEELYEEIDTILDDVLPMRHPSSARVLPAMSGGGH